MTIREKLIDICDTNYGYVDEVPADKFADYLIANGVTVQDGKDENVRTNADRIRAMSDEELAEFMCGTYDCVDSQCPGSAFCKYGEGKANGLKKWLKQPARE